MIKSLMYHKVEDLAKWKEAFDSFKDFRKSSGEKSYSVGNLMDHPNTAYVINKWESVEALQAFVGSDRLAKAMKEAGVIEQPHKLIFNEIEKG